jgi:phosphoribosylaminoimidazole-succinocarboxamide synthase
MAIAVLINSNIPNLKLLSKGKVRDIYATSSPEYLLFVASDRISAYDVILKNVNSLTVDLSSPYSHSPTFT